MFTKEEQTNQKSRFNLTSKNKADPGMIENKTKADSYANSDYFRYRNVGNNYLQSLRPATHNVGQSPNSPTIRRKPT